MTIDIDQRKQFTLFLMKTIKPNSYLLSSLKGIGFNIILLYEALRIKVANKLDDDAVNDDYICHLYIHICDNYTYL